MLQRREIAKILAQVVNEAGSLLNEGAFSASLLSSKGLPLVTVTSPDSPASDDSLSADTLRLYSLLAINSYKQQEKSGNPSLDDWTALSLSETLRAIVRKFDTVASHQLNDLYVVLFYNSPYSDSRAKASVDAVANLLADGLRGYISG